MSQHPLFAQALGALGRRAEVMDLGPAGRALAIRRRLPLLGEVAYLPRGPTWATEEPGLRAEALDRLASRGVRLLEAEAPCPSLRRAGFRAVATPAHVAELDLTGTPRARRAALAGTWRNALRRAEGAGLRLDWRRFEGEPGHWLLAREAGMRRERGYRALPPALACAFARTGPDAARVLVARVGAEPVAGMLFLLHPPVATYQIGWTGERGRTTEAHRLMLMAAADRLAEEGFVRLDLGTVDTETNPGLARFKIGAGARVRALGGSWVRLPFARPRL
ncbi:GNAT family N-acetyltransferase [Rubellimicrobium roseum]|uniref:GNAT family N-acetyltransferase n=1 Tax=Rubellimicrobium roseum TaxID=687525 RepID=UPI001C3F4327|nr:GNAT family N-acetyltransferase [Rubellimicrobium roseum]